MLKNRGRVRMLSVETARREGARVYASVRPALIRAWCLTRRLAPLAPLIVVAAALLLTARTYYLDQHYDAKGGYGRLAAFADIGTISGKHLGLQGLAMN